MLHVILRDKNNWNYGGMKRHHYMRQIRKDCLDALIPPPTQVSAWPNHLLLACPAYSSKLRKILKKYSNEIIVLKNEIK